MTRYWFRAGASAVGRRWLQLGWLALLAGSHASAQGVFEQCVAGLGEVALSQGVSARTLERILPGVAPLERVIRADRNQPEFVQTFGRYFGLRITEGRVATGRRLYDEHRELLTELTAKTGVPGQYLVAFWALESNFGGVLGDVPVFDSLATLACDRRRADYFTTEFVNALRIVDDGHAEAERMIGSWAGAMGQTQFMPSVFLAHATDGDRDGRIDVWGSAPDALASAANFVESLGWQRRFRWGREVRLPDGFDYALAGRDRPRPLSEWRALGIRDVVGNPVAALDIEAALVVPSGSDGPVFLVYDNFHVIMRWNRSEYFALTVGHLADRIAGGRALSVPADSGESLSSASLRVLQERLTSAGYDPGPADGVLGSGTRAAIRAYQVDLGLVADGYPGRAVLASLGID